MDLAPDFNEFCALLSARSVEFVIVEAHALAFHALTPSDIVAGKKVVEMGVPPVQIHVMSAIDGVNWDDVWATREAGTLATQAVALRGRASEGSRRHRGATRHSRVRCFDAVAAGA